jgi:soluble cytochrome b562
MFMLYLDASGTAQVQDATKNYVLVGVAVHENTWFALNKRIGGLKKKYAYPGEDFELHVKDFCKTISAQAKITGFEQMNQEDRRANVLSLWDQKLKTAGTAEQREELRKSHRRMHPFVHLTRQQRSQLYEDALDLVGGHSGLILFAEAIEKRHPAVVNGTVDCVRQAFEQVITRFDAFLHRKATWKRLSSSRRVHGDKGLIVMDRDLEAEKDIERQFTNYQEQGHPWGQLEHVIETPFFVSSNKFPGIQIGDVCAYALRRYLDQGHVAGSHEEKQFLRISHLFDRHQGKLHGLRHYTQGGTCQCMICKERGHS